MTIRTQKGDRVPEIVDLKCAVVAVPRQRSRIDRSENATLFQIDKLKVPSRVP